MIMSMMMIDDYVHDHDDDDDDDDDYNDKDEMRNSDWTVKINGRRWKSNCHHRGEKAIAICGKTTTVKEYI